MILYLLAAAVFAVAIAAMAAGVIFGKRRLRGTCGGLANLRDSDGRTMCDLCSHPSENCSGPDDARHADQSHRAEQAR